MSQIQSALSAVGVHIDNIYDLVNTSAPYPEAVPILIKLLSEGVGSQREREGIIRALAVKQAKGKANAVLMEEFFKSKNEPMYYRWAIGSTIYTIVEKNDLKNIMEIVLNKEHGMARQMFVLSLGKIKSVESEKTLVTLLTDGDVAGHALSALGKNNLLLAAAKIQELDLISNPFVLVRKESKKILNKIATK